MRIVLDMQGAQTSSRFRGIGRYTVSMAQALLRRESEHEIFLAFNALMPEAIVTIRQQLGDLIPDENILIWHGPGPVRDDNEDNTWRRRAAEECYKTFLQDLQADLLFISSYFEGYRENAVTCVAEAEFGYSTCVVIFDLIPLLNADQYLTNTVYANHYRRKLQEVQRAAGALTISEFSRAEALEALSFTPDQIVNTYLGADSRFQSLSFDPAQRQARLSELNIDGMFVLYAGGSDERKNLPRLIEAFAALPHRILNNHQLVLTGKYREIDYQELRRLAHHAGLASAKIHFTGYISDETLIELYNLCALFVFPSWHEGFGLPVLEAMACGAPAIAANCSSLPEVLNNPEAVFDPFDVAEISRKMSEVLSHPALREQMVEHGARQVKKFSWDTSAAIAMAKFDQLLSRQPVRLSLKGEDQALAMQHHYKRLIERIGALPAEPGSVSDEDLMQLARCIDLNQAEVRRVCRRVRLPDQSRWCVDVKGLSACATDLRKRPEKSAEGEMAQALTGIGQRITPHIEEADIVLGRVCSLEASRCDQVQIAYGLPLHQTTLSEEWVADLNQHAYGVVVPSRLLRKLLIDAGVYVPVAVSPDGLDEWVRVPAAARPTRSEKKYRFVCDISDVENDGLDVLLDAYGQVFVESDEVSLLVLADHHALSDVQACVDAWRIEGSSRAEVVFMPAADDAERKAIFLHAHCFVAPYRFTDQGLSVARAAALGLPVLTTGWGGQTDRISPENARLIDYRFTRATRSTAAFNAYWAEPERTNLGELMRQQYLGGGLGSSTRPMVSWRTWSESSTEINRLARAWSSGPMIRPPRIGWISTWNTRCGIASYSEHLTECMPDDVVIFAPRQVERIALDMDHVVRCWDHGDTVLDELSAEIEHRGIDTLVVQFNYGFFEFSALRDFLKRQAARSIKIVVVLHSTSDPSHAPDRRLETLVPAFKLCHRLLVHSVGDLNRLKSLGLVENVTLFPLGVKPISPRADLVIQKDAPENRAEDFLIASYGFFLPHKGLLELIDAVGLLRANGCQVSLRMVNAQYPIAESQTLVQQAQAKIEALGLTPYVRLMTDYLADEESSLLLQQADLVVYPYQETGESASAAVRFGLTAMRPVAVTPLAIFDDVEAAVFRLPGLTAEAIADGLQSLIADLRAKERHTLDRLEAAKAWCLAHQYPKLATRLAGILKAQPELSRDGLECSPHLAKFGLLSLGASRDDQHV